MIAYAGSGPPGLTTTASIEYSCNFSVKLSSVGSEVETMVFSSRLYPTYWQIIVYCPESRLRKKRPSLFAVVPLEEPLIITDAYGSNCPFSSFIRPVTRPAIELKETERKSRQSNGKCFMCVSAHENNSQSR